LFDTKNKPLTSVQLNQRFNKIFGKPCSVNQMRRTYLTTKFGKTIEENKNIQETMTAMGSLKQQLQNYVLQ
jgi:hypothetical protein